MLRFGIIGTNFISEWFVAACRESGGRAVPVAVCSRDRGRAEDFARRQGVPTGVDSLDELCELVDAVYVASPDLLHHEQAMHALAAGRHVLVEKAMAANLAQVVEILDAARASGLVAMEAMRNVHAPAHRVIAEHLPQLGTIRHARFEKLQYSSRYDRFRAGTVLNAFDPALANSALADIGIYCLEPALDLFGVPHSVQGSSSHLHNGFEAGGSMVLDHTDLQVNLAWSKVVSGIGPSVINGEDAWLSFTDPGEPREVVLGRRGAEPEVVFVADGTRPEDTMKYEVFDFCDQVEAGRLDERWARLTTEARRIMDAHLSATAAASDLVGGCR